VVRDEQQHQADGAQFVEHIDEAVVRLAGVPGFHELQAPARQPERAESFAEQRVRPRVGQNGFPEFRSPGQRRVAPDAFQYDRAQVAESGRRQDDQDQSGDPPDGGSRIIRQPQQSEQDQGFDRERDGVQ